MPEKGGVGLNILVTGAGRGLDEDIACVLDKEGTNCSQCTLSTPKMGQALETVETILL